MKQQVKLAGFLTFLSLVGLLLAIPYMIAVFGDSPAAAQAPMTVLLTASIVQNLITAFVCAWLGLIMAKSMGLDAAIFRRWVTKTGTARFEKGNILFALISGIIFVLITLAMDYFIFLPQLSDLKNTATKVSPVAGILTFMQGGVFEEVLVRLFLMTFIVWILFKLFGRKSGTKSWMYWIGIVGAAFLFGLSHLPAVYQILGHISPILFIRTIVLNGLPGLLFGYLYWKKGLEYAMVAHAIGDIVLHGFFG